MLLDEGLSCGAEHITFKRVFDQIEATDSIRITNASVIGRIWRDQADFQREVLMTAALKAPRLEIDKTLALVDEVLTGIDLSTPAARATALRDLIRFGGNSNFALLTHSESWRMWIALWSLHIAETSANPDAEISEVLTASYRATTDDYVAIFSTIFDRIGYRVIAPFSVEDFVVEIASVAEGLAIRETFEGTTRRTVELPTGADGELEEWNLFGIAVDALASRLLEPVDPA
jgi:hypothetical protein